MRGAQRKGAKMGCEAGAGVRAAQLETGAGGGD